MQTLRIETALERLVDQSEVTKRENLGESEYLDMVMAFCCDRREHSGARSHADTIDFDHPVMDSGLDLVPQIYELILSKKDMDAAKLCALLGRLACKAVLHSANEKIDDLFFAKRERIAHVRSQPWGRGGEREDEAYERARDRAMGCL